MGVDVVGLGLNATDVAIELPRYPEFNSKVEFLSAAWQAGGQVATALVVCQRLGLRAKYIGSVGSDAAGNFQRESLEREGLDLTDLRVVADCPNQTAYILIDQKSGERTILWRRDSRLALRPEHLRPEMIRGARLLHVDGHDTAAAAQAARWARQAGIPVTADVDNLYPGLEALLDQVDTLISSESFPGRYTGESDLLRALEELRRRHPLKLVAATLGRDGVVGLAGERFLYQPAFVVPCRDTTGAGDVFHGAFIYALLQGWAMERILEFSNALAGLSCRTVGARSGIATRVEAEELMARGEHHPRRWQELPPPTAPVAERAPGGKPLVPPALSGVEGSGGKG
ncbi:MAG: carbohydrate kinase family protein [Candidatus Acidoferrales bacterium]